MKITPLPKLRTIPGWLPWAALSFVLPVWLHYGFLLNLFYHFGAHYFDNGVFTHAIWRNGLAMPDTPAHGGGAFFGVHFVPLLYGANLLSYLVPTQRAEYFSMFIALSYGGLALALFHLLQLASAARRHWQWALMSMLSIAFAFNTIIANSIWLAHFEFYIPLGCMLFMVWFALGWRRLALAAFVFTLSIREDGGFHLLAPLTLLAAYKLWQRQSIRRELRYIAVAFVYGCAAWALSHYFASGRSNTTFANIYSGPQFYAHLNIQELLHRAGIMSYYHLYLWLGLLTSALFAWRLRAPWLLVGFAAYIPWLVLNWTAFNEHTGYMHTYYGFPFVLTLAWPVVAALWRYGAPLPQAVRRPILLLQALQLLFALVIVDDGKAHFGPPYAARWHGWLPQSSLEHRDRLHGFLAAFNAGQGDLGVVVANMHVQSLIDGTRSGVAVPFMELNRPTAIDTLVYLRANLDLEALGIAASNGLNRQFCVTGTTLCLFTNRSTEQLGSLAPFLTEKTTP